MFGPIIVFACIVIASLVGYLFGQNIGYRRGYIAGQRQQIREQIEQIRKIRSEMQ